MKYQFKISLENDFFIATGNLKFMLIRSYKQNKLEFFFINIEEFFFLLNYQNCKYDFKRFRAIKKIFLIAWKFIFLKGVDLCW